jgi:hypothetical protein
MANVPTQLSPGVNITEIDLSGIVREAGNNIAGFVGQFRWGPASESLLIDNERRLTDIFLNPTNDLPEKAQDDFFSAANFFRYSDKLKIVRVVSENARNARAGQSNPLGTPKLIHNDEEFFALADPSGLGAKNYSAVVENANWIARYPGDVGNSIEVKVIGAGKYIEGSVDNPDGGGCEPEECPSGFIWQDCGCVEIPPGGGGGGSTTTEESYYLPLLKDGQPLEGVTYAVVTVPQITEFVSAPFMNATYGGFTWANNFVHNGPTGARGNTFGVKYLCFFLRGSSYCNNIGTFPIPGGSYGYIAGSSAAGGLTYSAYYRDRWFYGTFGAGDNETSGSHWTKEGPLLAARNMLGVTLQATFDGESATWYRDQNFGKGFHQVSQSGFHGSNKGVISKGIIHRDETGLASGIEYQSYMRISPIVTLNDSANKIGPGWWPSTYYFSNSDTDPGIVRANPWCLEPPPDGDINKAWLQKPFTCISNGHFINTFAMNEFTFPNVMILPFDNASSAITEPYTNEFPPVGPGQKTYRESLTINGVVNAGLSVTRTATAYRSESMGRVVIRGITGGATSDGNDLANTPLRPVIDAFASSGITASGAKGMLLLFAIAQPINGITTGYLSPWHCGITRGSPVMADWLGPVQGLTIDISMCDGNSLNAATIEESTNILPELIPSSASRAQLIHGFEAEFDGSFLRQEANLPPNGDPSGINQAVGVVDKNYASFQTTITVLAAVAGGQATPFSESDIANIKDLAFRKQISP